MYLLKQTPCTCSCAVFPYHKMRNRAIWFVCVVFCFLNMMFDIWLMSWTSLSDWIKFSGPPHWTVYRNVKLWSFFEQIWRNQTAFIYLVWRDTFGIKIESVKTWSMRLINVLLLSSFQKWDSSKPDDEYGFSSFTMVHYSYLQKASVWLQVFTKSGRSFPDSTWLISWSRTSV